MGLDLVEMVMAVEQRFGIELSDADAERSVTPGILIETILSKVPISDASICLSRRAFHVIRKTFIQKFGCKRSAITPSTPLGSLVPREGRRRIWADLHGIFSANLPPLTRPVAVKQGLVLLFVAIFSGVLLTSGFTLRMLPLSAIIAGLGWAIGFKLTESTAVEFPKVCSTVGELAHHLAKCSDAIFKPQGRKWTRAEVAEGVKQITIDTLGLSPSDYREDAEFIKDFGAG
jgi:hypothetical protein